MRVITDISTNRLIQATSSPDDNTLTSVNGRYIVPIPEGVAVDITSLSYLTPQDSGSVPGQAISGLLARYPMYDYSLFNFMLEASDLTSLIDVPTLFPGALTVTRYQSGRSVGPSPIGIAPNSIAILPASSYRTVPAPGLVQFEYDIGLILPGGAREFLVWWQIAKMSVTEDIVSGYSLTAGTNQPSIKSYDEYEQEPADLQVQLSNDNATWSVINRLEPMDTGVTDTALRLAFINTGSEKIYLTAFAVLFVTP